MPHKLARRRALFNQVNGLTSYETAGGMGGVRSMGGM
jgi:hypothetical protein